MTSFAFQIEGYMFEEHELIRRAAVQCFTNLCSSPLQVERCEQKNDKVRKMIDLALNVEYDFLCVCCIGEILRPPLRRPRRSRGRPRRRRRPRHAHIAEQEVRGQGL